MGIRHSLFLSLALATVFMAAPARAQNIQCTIILDAASGKTLVRQGTCDQRRSPASSFKTVLALIGFDAGLLTDAHTPKLSYSPQPGAWMQNRPEADPEIWLRESILWYSQHLTRQLGEKRLADYVRKLGYGNADLSGDKGRNNGLIQSWVDSSLKISPDEQAAFIRRIVTCSLPISAEACKKTQNLMPRFTSSNGWAVRGKTGSFRHRDDKAGLRTSWFVGWAERDGKTIAFVRMGDSRGKKPPKPLGPQMRDGFLSDLPQLMK